MARASPFAITNATSRTTVGQIAIDESVLVVAFLYIVSVTPPGVRLPISMPSAGCCFSCPVIRKKRRRPACDWIHSANSATSQENVTLRTLPFFDRTTPTLSSGALERQCTS